MPKVEEKAIAEKSAIAPDVPEVDGSCFSGNPAKQLGGKEGAPKGNKRAAKPVTQESVAEAAKVGKTTVQDAFKTAEALTGVKIDLDKPETVKARQLEGKRMRKVVSVSNIVDKAAEQVANLPKVEGKDIIEKSIKSPNVPEDEGKATAEKSAIAPKSKFNHGKPVTQATVAEAAGVHRGVATGR